MTYNFIKSITIISLIFLCPLHALAEDQVLVKYHWHKGHSPYKEVSITISKSGETKVLVQKYDFPSINYQTTFSQEELGALYTLIESTDFFNQSEQKERFIKSHSGETELTITMEKNSKSLVFRHLPALNPLTQFMWRLTTQATAIKSIEEDKDIYSAVGSVKPNTSGMKALQPYRFKIPLMEYINSHNDWQKVTWALEALAAITTAEEYGGFIKLGLEGKQRELFLSIIGTHPFYGNIPKSHLKGLSPIYLVYARDFRKHIDKLNKIESQSLSEFTRLLGYNRYEPAIPVLRQWFEAHDKPFTDASFTPLAEMGEVSLRNLVSYLDSSNEVYKLNAIELLTIASRLSPYDKFSNPLPAYKYDRMVPIFTKRIIPKLENIANNDASKEVRKKATEAIKEIKRRINAHSRTTCSEDICVEDGSINLTKGDIRNLKRILSETENKKLKYEIINLKTIIQGSTYLLTASKPHYYGIEIVLTKENDEWKPLRKVESVY